MTSTGTVPTSGSRLPTSKDESGTRGSRRPEAGSRKNADGDDRSWERLAQPERPLTPHEIRIIGMLAAGDSYQAVANRLGVTVNTVRNYIRSIYVKLHVHTKSEAVSKALRAQIIS